MSIFKKTETPNFFRNVTSLLFKCYIGAVGMWKLHEWKMERDFPESSLGLYATMTSKAYQTPS